MSLNHFGKIAAAEIAFYAPILCISFYVSLKKGFSRREGWVFLFTFSLIRIVGASVTLASQLETNAPIGLFIAAGILQGIGLAPLLMATLGFVTSIAQYGGPSMTRSSLYMRLIRLLLFAGIILGIVGGSQQSPNNDASTITQGRTLTKAGTVLFLVGYAALFAIHVILWSEKESIPTNHRKLLFGVSLALPPLLVRIVYGLLNAFASSPQNRWSPIAGTWWIYLVMALIMEYLVVCVYVITGALTPLHEDPEPQAKYDVQRSLA